MSDFSHTQEILARAVGKSRSHVANMLRLLNLPDGVKSLLDDGTLTMGHARALLNAPDPESLAHDVVTKDLTVRQTERLAAAKKPPSKSEGKANRESTGGSIKDADTLALERDLSMMLGLKVAITLKGESGDIAIHFETLEQLDDVLHRLKRAPKIKPEE
jgi:ParB family chromosome partitioning protein